MKFVCVFLAVLVVVAVADDDDDDDERSRIGSHEWGIGFKERNPVSGDQEDDGDEDEEVKVKKTNIFVTKTNIRTSDTFRDLPSTSTSTSSIQGRTRGTAGRIINTLPGTPQHIGGSGFQAGLGAQGNIGGHFGPPSSAILGESLGNAFLEGVLGRPNHGGSLGNAIHGGVLGNPIHGGALGNPIHGGSLGNPIHGGSLGSPIHGGSLGNPIHGGALGNAIHGAALGTEIHGGALGTAIHAHAPGLTTGFVSGAIPQSVGIGAPVPPSTSTCRYWCRTPQGQVYCCENANQPQSFVGIVKPGQCPPVRPACPPFRSFGPPITCSSDGACGGIDKCCYDVCLEEHVCKPPLGIGR
ncbi:PE-PGRS family protein PE_PGRS16-like [Macrobrachium nipponense]|uniref:PE-PGRS family protein PE_PGRS16-like n=1 Tax=Macrobrachium nipponense TaxID=159736 RepID=UPI0030C7BC40